MLNPQRACAARVTVLCVCLSVCLSVSRHYIQATKRPILALAPSLLALEDWAYQRYQRLQDYASLKNAETTAFDSEEPDTVADIVACGGPTHQLAVCMRMFYAFERLTSMGSARSASVYPEGTRSHNEGQCIDSRMLFTTVASPCLTLRELVAGETHTDSPAHQLAVWRMHSSPSALLQWFSFHIYR